ncbi:hypothetical protein EDD11_008229 [Mortierella claussenii]|nr:hypothetical protein EDD11_008229 [Mortierella claussenii]
MDLPVELEYIPYHELEDRFMQLNKIARLVYPTIWPNIILGIIFVGLFTTAAVGIKSGSGLAIMSQGACFILPIIAILWIRVRKETKAKARKKFKQRSQKLLRAWTAQDFVSHAIQWKLRIRPKKKRTSTQATTSSSTPAEVTGPAVEQEQGRWRWNRRQRTRDSHRTEHVVPEMINIQPQNTSMVIVQVDHDAGVHDQHPQQQQIEAGIQSPVSVMSPSSLRSPTAAAAAAPTPAVATPRRVADVYSALRRTPTMQQPQYHPHPNPRPHPHPHDSVGFPPLTTTDTSETPTTTALPPSKWEPWLDLLRDLYCCAFIFKEAKVWMIEISIRDGVLDEYAVPVPSPAYCDYRLPGYEDVVMTTAMTSTPRSANSGITTATTTTSIAATAAGAVAGARMTLAAAVHQPRYIGSPPAYESDSENESNDGDDDEDDEEDDNSNNNHNGAQGDTHTDAQRAQVGSDAVESSSSSSSSNNSNSSNNAHARRGRGDPYYPSSGETVGSAIRGTTLTSASLALAWQRPMEMTSVLISSSPVRGTVVDDPSILIRSSISSRSDSIRDSPDLNLESKEDPSVVSSKEG